MTKICAAITEKTSESVIHAAESAKSKGAELVELRLDYLEDMSEENMKKIFDSIKLPKIATLRPEREGGKFSGDESQRINFLLTAINQGVEYVDLEISSDVGWRYEIGKKAKEKKCEVIMSYHNFNETPEYDRLAEIVKNEFAAGATIAKVATMAKSFDDVLRILQLVNNTKKNGEDIVGICMGPLGKLTRLPIESSGNYMTYASLGTGQESAPGQILLDDAIALSKILDK